MFIIGMDIVSSWGSMRIIIFVLLIASCSCKGEWFTYDRAIYDAQRQDWAGSLERLNASLIDHPDDPSLLYDTGVVSYKSANYKQAQDYFKRAAQSKVIEKPLQEQAYFNLGNSCCALQEYKDAISAYEQALNIDPTDERVQHNLKKARELLAAQQQKEKEQEQQKKEQEKKQEQQSEQQDKSQQKQDSESQEQQNQQGKSDKDKKQQGKGQNEQQDKQSGNQESEGKQDQQGGADKQEQKKNGSQRGSGEQQDQQTNKDNKQQKSEEQQSGNGQKQDGSDVQEKQQGNDKQSEGAQQKEQGSGREQFDHKQGEQANNAEKQQQGKQGHEQKSDRKPAGSNGENAKDAGREQTFDDHGQSPQDQGQSGQSQNPQPYDMQTGSSMQAMQVQQGKKQAQLGTQEQSEKKVDARLMWIMQEQERNDAQRSKGLIKGMIGKQLVGQDGQHCW